MLAKYRITVPSVLRVDTDQSSPRAQAQRAPIRAAGVVKRSKRLSAAAEVRTPNETVRRILWSMF